MYARLQRLLLNVGIKTFVRTLLAFAVLLVAIVLPVFKPAWWLLTVGAVSGPAAITLFRARLVRHAPNAFRFLPLLLIPVAMGLLVADHISSKQAAYLLAVQAFFWGAYVAGFFWIASDPDVELA